MRLPHRKEDVCHTSALRQRQRRADLRFAWPFYQWNRLQIPFFGRGTYAYVPAVTGRRRHSLQRRRLPCIRITNTKAFFQEVSRTTSRRAGRQDSCLTTRHTGYTASISSAVAIRYRNVPSQSSFLMRGHQK